jgi:NADH dehydrogenase
VPRPGQPAPVPPRAQAAHQEASFMVKQIEARLHNRALGDYVYKDFGSLVWLGKRNSVGSLMGFLTGRNFFIEGYLARLAYRSLYKMHEAALHGSGRTFLGLFSPGARPAPSVKLH